MENTVSFGLIILAYFLGAVPFGLIVARAFGVDDIRATGSGNIGATNVYRVAGRKAAALVFALDIGKGILPVYLASQIEQTLMPLELFMVACAAAAVLGHIFPVYLRFRGGKGVNTALGSLIILMPREVGVALVVFTLTVVLTRYISLGSLLAALSLVTAVLFEKLVLQMPVSKTYLILSAALAVLIFLTHRKNIGRLLSGSENRFSLKSGKREEQRPA